MGIADIFNLPGNDDQLAFWSRMHMVWHRSAIVEIQRQHAIILAEFLLDPISVDEIDVFLANHQTMHNDLDAILQVPSQDLTNVDWEDETQRIGWFQAHAQQTQQESNKLGIGA
jgi:hypothetical protein